MKRRTSTYDLMQELTLLDPTAVVVYRDEFEDLYLREGDSEPVGPLIIECVQPISHVDGMLIFRNMQGTQVGLLRRLNDLPCTSRAVVQHELRMAYRTPVITSILSIDTRSFFPRWDVQTDVGRRSFEVRSSTHDVRILADGRAFLRDADSNRYWIPDIAELDSASRTAIEEFV